MCLSRELVKAGLSAAGREEVVAMSHRAKPNSGQAYASVRKRANQARRREADREEAERRGISAEDVLQGRFEAGAAILRRLATEKRFVEINAPLPVGKQRPRSDGLTGLRSASYTSILPSDWW